MWNDFKCLLFLATFLFSIVQMNTKLFLQICLTCTAPAVKLLLLCLYPLTHFSKSMVKSAHFYNNTSTQTDLHVRRSVRSECVDLNVWLFCFFTALKWVSHCYFFCLYPLTLVVLFQGQLLNCLILTAAPTYSWTYRSERVSDLYLLQLVSSALKSVSRWYNF